MTDDRPRDDPAEESPPDRSDDVDGTPDDVRTDPDDSEAASNDDRRERDDDGSRFDDDGIERDDGRNDSGATGDGVDSAGDDSDEARKSRGAGEWLTTLLRSLDRFDRLSGRGRGRSRTALDFDVSIGSGLDSLDDSLSRGRRSGGPPSNPRRDRKSLGRRPRGRYGSSRSRRRVGPSGDHHVTVRTHEDELIVTADVAGADQDEVTVGFDGGSLVVGVEGQELERVSIPWEDRDAEATVRNGILTVRVEHDTNE